MIAKVIIVVSKDRLLAEQYLFAVTARRSLVWPESGLHPRRHFAAVASQIKTALAGEPLVILTHSDTILTAIGELVELGKIPPDAVEVRMIEGETVRTFVYDRKGYLGPNWSIGWFTADDAIDDWKAVER